MCAELDAVSTFCRVDVHGVGRVSPRLLGDADGGRGVAVSGGGEFDSGDDVVVEFPGGDFASIVSEPEE